MMKLVLLFICLAVAKGRNIQRFAREEAVNATTPDLKNATASADDPPEVSEFQADLVAPASGPKPLEAKYTIRVKPKLKDGIPQIQEIRIMPPKIGNSTKGNVKPLMVLKQNVTKPMIENIEIDVPEKGMKYSSKPSVEVIEGDHKEMMKVTKGEAVVENAAQKSDTNSEEKQDKSQDETASKNATESSTSQNATEASTSKNAADSATSQKATQQSTSHDASEKNKATAAQTPAATQTQPSAQAAPVTTQTQPSAQAAPVDTQTQSPAQAAPAATQTQSSAQTAPAAPQTQPSAQVALAAPAYSQPAPAPAAYSSAPQPCSDDGRCYVYPDDRCQEQWLMTNCRRKCRFCS